MGIFLGSLLTLLSGFAWGREAAFCAGLIGIGVIGMFGYMWDTHIPFDDPIMYFPDKEKEFVQRGERKALYRTLRCGFGVLVALFLLVVAGY